MASKVRLSHNNDDKPTKRMGDRREEIETENVDRTNDVWIDSDRKNRAIKTLAKARKHRKLFEGTLDF